MKPSEIDATKTPAIGMAWHLHEMLQNTSDGTARRLSFLALDPARKHFGSDWPMVAAKVHGIVTATVRAFLVDGEVYSAADGLSYVIMAINREPSEFDKLMIDISSEISSKITGRGSTKDLVAIVHLSAYGDLGAEARGKRPCSAEDGAAMHLSNIERILGAADTGKEEFALDGITYALSPIISADVMSASAYLCVPALSESGAVGRSGYGVLPSGADSLLYAEMDALTVEFASKKLKESKDRHLVVQIPVNRETLSSKKYREMYLKICHGLLTLHKDGVIFDVYGIDEGTPSNRVAEYIQWLRPYASAIAVTVGVDFSTMSVFAGTNAISIGIDLKVAGGDCTSQRIGKFIGRVKAASMACHIHGIDSRPLADFCLRQGVEYMDGGLISEGLT